MKRTRTNLCTLLALATLAPFAAAQTRVTLRSEAQVLDAGPVTLSEVALIEGPDAAAVGSVVVHPENALPATLTPASIREALSRAQGVNPGRVLVSGAAVRITIGAPAREKQEPAPPVAAPSAGPTVRDMIPREVARALGVSEADVRVELDDADAALLGTTTDARTVVISPTGRSDAMAMHVRVYEGDALVLAQTTRVRVLVRRSVGVLTQDLDRGADVTQAAARREERWLRPSEDPADLAQPGLVARGRLRAGEMLLARDVEAPIAVRKGQVVAVDCVSGGVLVRWQMRALSDARAGEVIELISAAPRQRVNRNGRSLTSERPPPARRVRARIDGPGRAVVISDDLTDETPTTVLSPRAEARSAPDAAPTLTVEVRRTGGAPASPSEPAP